MIDDKDRYYTWSGPTDWKELYMYVRTYVSLAITDVKFNKNTKKHKT